MGHNHKKAILIIYLNYLVKLRVLLMGISKKRISLAKRHNYTADNLTLSGAVTKTFDGIITSKLQEVK